MLVSVTLGIVGWWRRLAYRQGVGPAAGQAALILELGTAVHRISCVLVGIAVVLGRLSNGL